MKTERQIRREYGAISTEIMQNLKGVGCKKNDNGELLFYDDDIEKAKLKIINGKNI